MSGRLLAKTTHQDVKEIASICDRESKQAKRGKIWVFLNFKGSFDTCPASSLILLPFISQLFIGLPGSESWKFLLHKHIQLNVMYIKCGSNVECSTSDQASLELAEAIWSHPYFSWEIVKLECYCLEQGDSPSLGAVLLNVIGLKCFFIFIL